MQTKQLHINLPKHLAVRIEDRVIEKFGYKAKGGVTLLIIEALENEFNPNRKSEKNGLAPVIFPPPQGNKRQSLKPFVKKLSDISHLLSYILTCHGKNKDYGVQLTSDNKGVFISTYNLENAIIETFPVSDKRPVQRIIRQLISGKIISPWDHDKQNKKPMNYSVNMDLILEEYKPILESVKIPILEHYDPVPISSSLKALPADKTNELNNDEIIDYILVKEDLENNSRNRMAAQHRILYDYIKDGKIQKVDENNFNILSTVVEVTE